MLIKNGNERYKGEKLATLKTHLAVQLKNEDLPKALIPSALRPDQTRAGFHLFSMRFTFRLLSHELVQRSPDHILQMSLEGSPKRVK